MDDSVDGGGLEDDEDVERHFKSDLEETGSMTSQDDGGCGGGGGTEHSGYHSEEDGSEMEGSDEVSVIEDVTASQPPHTNYTADPPEVFGTVNYSTCISIRCKDPYIAIVVADWRSDGGIQRRKQIHSLVSHEAGPSWHGSIKGGASDIYPRASILP